MRARCAGSHTAGSEGTVFVDVQGIDVVHVKGRTAILLTSDWTQQRQPRLGAANPLSCCTALMLLYTLLQLYYHVTGHDVRATHTSQVIGAHDFTDCLENGASCG